MRNERCHDKCMIHVKRIKFREIDFNYIIINKCSNERYYKIYEKSLLNQNLMSCNINKIPLRRRWASGYEIFIRPYFTRIISGVFYKSHLQSGTRTGFDGGLNRRIGL